MHKSIERKILSKSDQQRNKSIVLFQEMPNLTEVIEEHDLRDNTVHSITEERNYMLIP